MKIRVLMACGLAATFASVRADSLSDPTRPPAAFGSPEAVQGAGEGSNLQSIIRSNRGKPGAMINGEYVLLGGMVGEAKLVKIGEDSVTLKTASGTETLMLVPGVEKTPTKGVGQEGKKMRRDRNEGKK